MAGMGLVLSSIIQDIQRPPFGEELRRALSEFCASICVILIFFRCDRVTALGAVCFPDACFGFVQLLEHPNRASAVGHGCG